MHPIRNNTIDNYFLEIYDITRVQSSKLSTMKQILQIQNR